MKAFEPARAALASGILAIAAPACDIGAPPPDPPAPGTIEGRIQYAGALTGVLEVEAWDAMPPVGPPLGAATVASGAFPRAFRLEGLASGEYFLTARLSPDAGGGAAALGAFPSVLALSPVVLEEGRGLAGADFAVLDEGDRPEGPVELNGARTLSGTVSFAGAVGPTDALRGALYRTFPASGAPADLQILNVAAPAFPHAFEFSAVRDGTYYVVFYLDRGGDSPFGPGPEDSTAWALDASGAPRPSTIALGAGTSGADVILP